MNGIRLFSQSGYRFALLAAFLRKSERPLQLPTHGLLTPADKVTIDTILCHQFLVCAALNDLSFVHHENLIGMADGFQPVSDHDNCFLLCQLADRFHQFFFILRIDVSGGLVQNDDRCILHHGAGDG